VPPCEPPSIGGPLWIPPSAAYGRCHHPPHACRRTHGPREPLLRSVCAASAQHLRSVCAASSARLEGQTGSFASLGAAGACRRPAWHPAHFLSWQVPPTTVSRPQTLFRAKIWAAVLLRRARHTRLHHHAPCPPPSSHRDRCEDGPVVLSGRLGFSAPPPPPPPPNFLVLCARAGFAAAYMVC